MEVDREPRPRDDSSVVPIFTGSRDNPVDVRTWLVSAVNKLGEAVTETQRRLAELTERGRTGEEKADSLGDRSALLSDIATTEGNDSTNLIEQFSALKEQVSELSTELMTEKEQVIRDQGEMRLSLLQARKSSAEGMLIAGALTAAVCFAGALLTHPESAGTEDKPVNIGFLVGTIVAACFGGWQGGKWDQNRWKIAHYDDVIEAKAASPDRSWEELEEECIPPMPVPAIDWDSDDDDYNY